MNIKRQTRLLYLYEGMMSFRMVDAVWVIFLLGRGYSLAQVGLAEGIFHVTSMLFEVPSGMVADLFGRRRTLILSGAANILFSFFMAQNGWHGWIYVGMIFSALGFNLTSGTESAMVYDSLLEAGCEEKYKKVWANMSVLGRIARAVSCAMSPVAILLGYQYTYLVMGVMGLGQILTAAGMREPGTAGQSKEERFRGEAVSQGSPEVFQRATAVQSGQETLQRVTAGQGRPENFQDEETGRGRLRTSSEKMGDELSISGRRKSVGVQAKLRESAGRIREHIRATASFIRQHPRTMLKLFADAAVACPCYLLMMYLQEHLVNCGWPEEWIGMPILLIPLGGAVGAWIAGRNRSGLFRAMMACGILGGIGTILAGSRMLAVTILGASLAQCCEGFSEIVINESTNREFSSEQRATLDSVDSMLYSILMVAASPLTGVLGSRYSIPVVCAVLGGILMGGTVIGGLAVSAARRA